MKHLQNETRMLKTEKYVHTTYIYVKSNNNNNNHCTDGAPSWSVTMGVKCVVPQVRPVQTDKKMLVL